MMDASYEFEAVIKNELKVKPVKELVKRAFEKLKCWEWKLIEVIAILSLLEMVITMVLFWYFGVIQDCKVAGAVAYGGLILSSTVYVCTMERYKTKKHDTLRASRMDRMKKIQDEMVKDKLPLPLVGKAIRADIENELKQIQDRKAHAFEFIKNAFNTLVIIPFGFLLTNFFQSIFMKETIATTESASDFFSFMLMLLTVLLAFCLTVIALYFPACGFIRTFLYGETILRECLDVLNEIETEELAKKGGAEITPAE